VSVPRSQAPTAASFPVFEERLTSRLAPDAWRFALPLLLVGGGLLLVGAEWAGGGVLLLGLSTLGFFRNPEREIPSGEREVVSPADGRVIAVGTVETDQGEKALRIGIFLSIFDVHINRAPVEGRVVAIGRSGDAYRAAFDPAAERQNVRCAITLEMSGGVRVQVVQITGWIARRIVCQPKVGEWLRRGVRYGLIRFGSRTDVLLPPGSRACVVRGDRVRGGSSVVAELPPEGEPAS